jgi:hypothetical protein
MSAGAAKEPPTPLFIRWEFPAVTTRDGEIRAESGLRKSSKYIGFAQYLLKNPPNTKPLKPSKIPGGYATVLSYRNDVENWVARQMMKSLQLHKEATEDELFANVIEELHNLPWSTGSRWRGFFLVMPSPEKITAAKREDLWGLKGMGKEARYYKAKGLGTWREPDYTNMELWQARKTVQSILMTLEGISRSALTGRKIAQLSPREAREFIRTQIDSLSRALPELPE